MNAIDIILDEHRSLAAVLHGLLYLTRSIQSGKRSPDFKLFGAMIHYIAAFPERFHHPKEDQYLFRLLRERHPESGALIDGLSADHQAGDARIRDLERVLRSYEFGGADALPAFAKAVEAYAAFHWQHMRTEEDEILPLAKRYLTADDWTSIDRAFAGNTDPLIGAKAGTEYDALFRRIVHLAPPPIGVGPQD